MINTYEQMKLNLFKRKRDEADGKLKWWSEPSRAKKYSHFQIHEMCSQYGFEVQCFQDIIDNLSREVDDGK